MTKALPVLAACALLTVGISQFADATHTPATRRPRLSSTVVRGPDIAVTPFSVTDVGAYEVNCPFRYRATGFGVLLGANSLVYADVNEAGTGYSFAFANGSRFAAFQSSGSVVCIRGTGGLKVIAASAKQRRAHREAVAAARRSLRR